jgi:hypothetical protein
MDNAPPPKKPKKKLCHLTSFVLCFFLDFLMFEKWADKLSQNIGNELPLFAA